MLLLFLLAMKSHIPELVATTAQFLTWYRSLELLGFWKTTPFSCSILITSLKTLWILLELESFFDFTWMGRKEQSRWWEISAPLSYQQKLRLISKARGLQVILLHFFLYLVLHKSYVCMYIWTNQHPRALKKWTNKKTNHTPQACTVLKEPQPPNCLLCI